jgi:hypothetical protein
MPRVERPPMPVDRTMQESVVSNERATVFQTAVNKVNARRTRNNKPAIEFEVLSKPGKTYQPPQGSEREIQPGDQAIRITSANEADRMLVWDQVKKLTTPRRPRGRTRP